MKLLTEEFLAPYPSAPNHMSPLASFVFYRTYSRWLDDKGRRETWKEAVTRAVEYNVGISIKHLKGLNRPYPIDKIKIEAETLFDNIFNLRQALSGRTHWVGGADSGVAEKFPLANFNCAMIEMSTLNNLSDLFYLLLVGTGVGVRCSKDMANGLAPIRTDFNLIASEYRPLLPKERLQQNIFNDLGNGYAKIYVADNKEGWAGALQLFFNILTDVKYEHIKHIKVNYNSIRPRGERLKTFGGTASGYEPLKEMFEGFTRVIKGEMDYKPTVISETHSQLRPVNILDIICMIGNNVVVGGVRRTALNFLFDADDYETMFAKYGINGIWDEAAHQKFGKMLDELSIKPDWFDELKMYDADARPMHHRRMSNNSIVFTEKPTKEFLDMVMFSIKNNGEPGFLNMQAAQARRFDTKGVNPCFEILLDSKGVCNLTTLNMMAFVKSDGTLDYQGLMQAQALSTRANMRMTLIDLELPEWDFVHKRDRLMGVSLTGWKDAMSALGYNEEQEKNLQVLLRQVAEGEAQRYSYVLRTPLPLLITTVKPEGTLSQVFNGVSSGLHYSYDEYYIRRIRINKDDALAKLAMGMGWVVNPEVGTKGDTYEEQMQNARTIVVDFPVKSPASRTSKSVSVKEQFANYFSFQENYTDHNSSNTIYVRDDEWEEVKSIILEGWENYIGVSFLAISDDKYNLMPYEGITKEEYEELVAKTPIFTPDMLQMFEEKQTESDLSLADECTSGACPIR